MGQVGSAVAYGIRDGVQSFNAHLGIIPNPVVADLEKRIKEEEKRAQRAEEDKKKAQEGERRAEEQRKRAEEDAARKNEEKRCAEERQHRAEQDAERVMNQISSKDAEMQRALDEIRAVEEKRKLADKEKETVQAQLAELRKSLEDHTKPILLPTLEAFNATKERLQYNEKLFHFAMAGNVGSGKSSLINAIRGYKNNSSAHRPVLAPVGVIETTSKITRYPDLDPESPLVWYDIPGAGTLKQPDYAYFNDQGLYIFDCIIVLIDAALTETDIAILRSCQSLNIPCYIVRSKSFQHIRNIIDDWDEDDEKLNVTEEGKWEMARSHYEKETRESVARNLQQAGLPEQKLYLVDKVNMVLVVKGPDPRLPKRTRFVEQRFMDERELLQDITNKALSRRTR